MSKKTPKIKPYQHWECLNIYSKKFEVKTLATIKKIKMSFDDHMYTFNPFQDKVMTEISHKSHDNIAS